ncbi:ribosome silencing factor [Desulfohalobium retbaense]|uniref:Ribosomal silencing factor RsfS n=1 Tax=Desulfohalobium retbaense (strain ATCC 49708 / DSM 5692 / JCM 16813 / HR100) TaxID=485915 RepID=C8X2A5_DESRD|nr:ribosome silencing factor [Desulfohalobium retbaense]ACV68428.1 iojap-like protein [Desulfohalobium retbaense DSM 5692]
MAHKKQTDSYKGDYLRKTRDLLQWLEEKQAKDMVALDVSKVCNVTEALVVVSAGSARHAQALADGLLAKLAEHGIELMGMEGYRTGTWILIDINDVLVHIFQEEYRGFYNVEGLWTEGETIVPEPEPKDA